MEFELRAVVFGLVLPGLVSLVALTLAARFSRGWVRALTGVALFLGIVLSAVGLGLGPLRPLEAWQWIPWLALFVSLGNSARTHIAILEIFYVLISLLASRLLVPDIERLAEERWLWLFTMPVVILTSISSAVMQTRKLDGPSLPFFWLLITLAGAVLTGLASLNTFAHLGGMLMAVVAGCLVAAWIFPTRSLTSIIAPGWATFFSGLVMEAKLASFSEVSLASYMLILIAPFMIWLTAIPGVRKMKPIWRTTIGTLCVLAPLAIGLALAGQVALRDVEEW